MPNKFYARKKDRSRPTTGQTDQSPACTDTCHLKQNEVELVRFVLKSAQYLDMKLETVEEVMETFSGSCRCALTGEDVAGHKVILPWENIAYITEVHDAHTE